MIMALLKENSEAFIIIVVLGGLLARLKLLRLSDQYELSPVSAIGR